MDRAYIEVDTAALKQDSETLRQQTEAAEKSLKNLAEDLTRLNAVWKGAANAAFQKQVAEDAEFISEVLKEAVELIGCMEYAANEYVKCENDVADMVDAVRI